MKSNIGLAASLVVVWLSAGCADKNDTQPPPSASATAAPTPSAAPTPEPIAAPKPSATAQVAFEIPAGSTKIFNERCALCHGKGGKGDGAGGAGMKPPPRNWTDATWQASVDDEHIATTLVKGGAAVGKSSTMPPNPDLEGGFKRDIVDGLVHIVRSFNKPAVAP